MAHLDTGYWESIILTFSLQVLHCCAGTSQSHYSHMTFHLRNQTSTVEAVGAATQSTRSHTSTAQWHGLGTNPQWEESALLLDANLRRNFGFNPQCHTNKKALRIFPMCVSWFILPTWQAGAAGISGDTRQRTCFACNRHMLLVELLDVGVAWCRGSRTLTSSLQRRKKNMSKLKLNSNWNLVIRPPRFWSCFPICMSRCKGWWVIAGLAVGNCSSQLLSDSPSLQKMGKKRGPANVLLGPAMTSATVSQYSDHLSPRQLEHQLWGLQPLHERHLECDCEKWAL